MSHACFVRRTCPLSVLFAVALGLSVESESPAVALAQSREPVLSAREDSQALARIREKLRDPVTLEFVETPLADAIQFLKDFTGANFVLDHRAVAQEGANADTPVSIHVQNIKLSSALSRMLGQINLTWILQDDCLMITGELAADNVLITRSYPVGDLAGTPGDGAKLITIASQFLMAGSGERLLFLDSLKALVLTGNRSAHARLARLCEQLRGGSEEPESVRTIRAKLNNPVTLEFVGTPISDVIDFLRDHTEVNIVMNRPALEKEGVNSDTPVSIHVQSMELRSALTLLLNEANLTFTIEDECLVITSKAAANERFDLRGYPVGKLLAGQLTLSGEDWLRLANSISALPKTQGVIGFYDPNKTLVVLGPESFQNEVTTLIGLIVKTAERSVR